MATSVASAQTGFSTSGGDPSIDVENIIYNHTGTPWSQYLTSVVLTQPFALVLSGSDAPYVNAPSGWSYSVTEPPAMPDQNGDYTAYLLVSQSSGNEVESLPPGVKTPSNELDFGYTVEYSGSGSPIVTQSFGAVPEPSTLSLLIVASLISGVGLIAHRRLRHASNVSICGNGQDDSVKVLAA
jgi:hypothetical protein